jgi:hypothetical protein
MVHVTSKNYSFVITYLLEDEQQLSLGMLDTSQMYLKKFIPHACFTPFASCFVYTSWRFYAISGTNLLTRCHSASFLFSVVLCFRKATQEIFSELDETKTETPIFPGRRTRTEREPEGGQRAGSPWGGAPPPGCAQGW